jgi:Flp pilus assembly CpaF family ATPase
MVLGGALGVTASVVYVYSDSTSAEKKVVNILISGAPGSGKGTLFSSAV